MKFQAYLQADLFVEPLGVVEAADIVAAMSITVDRYSDCAGPAECVGVVPFGRKLPDAMRRTVSIGYGLYSSITKQKKMAAKTLTLEEAGLEEAAE